jgi:rare lipoprotein A (peptidoglycan hydrolase)
MHLFKQLAAGAAIVALVSPAHAAGIGAVQMPRSTFDGVHNTLWDPSSVNRIESLQAKVASIRGTASWYGVPDGFHGRRTASGEIFNAYGLSAAHKSLPFGTRVRVTNLNNGRSVELRVTDRGPFVPGRIIDLSQGAAAKIGMISTGTAPVKVEILR